MNKGFNKGDNNKVLCAKQQANTHTNGDKLDIFRLRKVGKS